MSGFDFAKVVGRYVVGFQTHNESLMGSALRWLRAEYRTKIEARQDLEVRSIIDDVQFYDYPVRAPEMRPALWHDGPVLPHETVHTAELRDVRGDKRRLP